jgi:hypothetical protein
MNGMKSASQSAEAASSFGESCGSGEREAVSARVARAWRRGWRAPWAGC